MCDVRLDRWNQHSLEPLYLQCQDDKSLEFSLDDKRGDVKLDSCESEPSQRIESCIRLNI